MVLSKFGAILIAAAACANLVAAAPRIDPSVHRTLREQGSVNLIVTMKEGTETTLESLQESAFESRGALIADMVDQLEQHAQASQVELTTLLAQESFASAEPLFKSAQSFWISNQVFIEAASADLIEQLGSLDSVAEVREELQLPLPTPIQSTASNNTVAANEWGISMIKASDVWAAGNTGKNVIVSSIDSGVRGSHVLLKGNFRGQYGWFDPEKKAAAPYDNNGHGTHTMGTIAGANGVGVAPGATWMSCKGCRTSSCPESDLLACAQFITCPTDPKGNNKDCTKAPHLVSNSWGGGQGSTFYKASVDAWRKAGIIPVFANGNSGPNCGTANSPGDLPTVIAVGATDSSDALASFSSKGPAVTGLLKPDISAPGKDVKSTWHTSDTATNQISGTSMACPHVSGVVALLLSAKPGLTFDQVKSQLTKTVDTASLKPAGRTCGGTPDGKFPNNNFGYGRVNAWKAVTQA